MEEIFISDWKMLDGQGVIWKIAYVLITIVVLLAILVVNVTILFLNTGLTGELTPGWTELTAIIFLIYIVGVIVIVLLMEK